jgi:hypothetical protein
MSPDCESMIVSFMEEAIREEVRAFRQALEAKLALLGKEALRRAFQIPAQNDAAPACRPGVNGSSAAV